MQKLVGAGGGASETETKVVLRERYFPAASVRYPFAGYMCPPGAILVKNPLYRRDEKFTQQRKKRTATSHQSEPCPIIHVRLVFLCANSDTAPRSTVYAPTTLCCSRVPLIRLRNSGRGAHSVRTAAMHLEAVACPSTRNTSEIR